MADTTNTTTSSTTSLIDVKPLRYWTYKVLPLVYDDSLSYLEILSKAVYKLNQLIANNNKLPELIKEAIADGGYLDNLQEQIAGLNDKDSKTATADRYTGELIWLNGDLYRITRNMLAGDQYVESAEGITGNIEKLTFEEFTNRFLEYVKLGITANDEEYNSSATKAHSVGNILWWNGELYRVITAIAIGDSLGNKNLETITIEDILGEIINALNTEVTDRNNTDNQLQDNINAEAQARTQADNQLQDSINNLNTERNKLIRLDSDNNTEIPTDNNVEVQAGKDFTVTAGGDKSETITGNTEENYNGNLSEYVQGNRTEHTYGTVTENNDGGETHNTPNAIFQNGNKIFNALTRIVNVKDYGAVGDGVTDDTEAFNKAIEAAGTNGIIFVPYGKYITTTIQNHNITVLQEPGTVVTDNAESATTDYLTNPVANTFNKTIGNVQKYSGNMINLPREAYILNSTDAISTALADTAVIGSITSGTNIITVQSSEGIHNGDAVLCSATDWPSGTTTTNCVRVISISGNNVTVGIDSGEGAGVGNTSWSWSGSTISNNVFTFRHRTWVCPVFIGVTGADDTNPDRINWGANIVGFSYGEPLIGMEIDSILNKNRTDGGQQTGLLITGQNNSGDQTIGIQLVMGGSHNGSFGLNIDRHIIGVQISALTDIVLGTHFTNNESGNSELVAGQIASSNFGEYISLRPNIALKGLVNGAVMVALKRVTDDNPVGFFIRGTSEDGNTQLFGVDVLGNASLAGNFTGANIGATQLDATRLRLENAQNGEVMIQVQRPTDTSPAGYYFRGVGADGSTQVVGIDVLGNAAFNNIFGANIQGASFSITTAPTAKTITCTHTIEFTDATTGTVYEIPCAVKS